MESAVRKRADARRSRAAILDAAARTLNAEPDTGLEAIAEAAGVTRQTVYAHFASRDQLLVAVVDGLTQEAVAAMDAADPDAGPAADALLRLLDASAQTARRFPVLLQKFSALPVSPQTDHDRHSPVAERIKRVVQRGQHAGEFNDQLPPDWLVTVAIKLAHAASEEQDAGRMSGQDAQDALRTSLLRILGAVPRDSHEATGSASMSGNP